jgi:hypothetical protein
MPCCDNYWGRIMWYMPAVILSKNTLSTSLFSMDKTAVEKTKNFL